MPIAIGIRGSITRPTHSSFRLYYSTTTLALCLMGFSAGWTTTRTTMTMATTSPSSSSPVLPLRGVFVGSGSDGMSDPRIAQLILDMVDHSKLSCTTMTQRRRPIQVLYLGTATYDLPCFAQRQTQWFTSSTAAAAGSTKNHGSTLVDDDSGVVVVVSSLEVVHQSPTKDEIRTKIDMADIIVVGGGNTLYAVDRWKKLNMVPMLQSAIERGVIVTGGSAGAICWFDGGHSDPDTYYGPMMQKFGSTIMKETNDRTTQMPMDESITTIGVDKVKTETAGTNSNNDEEKDAKKTKKDWKYIRVPGLGFLPGLVCPHHDRIQSNGVLRAHDFDEMLLQYHPDEVGIGIDHWAALVVDRAQDSFRVVSLEGKPGSVVYHNLGHHEEDGYSFSANGQGVPGVWLKQVQDGKVVARAMPSSGKLSDILRPAKSIVEDDDALARCRQENPDILLGGG